jgi:hypothetical protein
MWAFPNGDRRMLGVSGGLQCQRLLLPDASGLRGLTLVMPARDRDATEEGRNFSDALDALLHIVNTYAPEVLKHKSALRFMFLNTIPCDKRPAAKACFDRYFDHVLQPILYPRFTASDGAQPSMPEPFSREEKSGFHAALARGYDAGSLERSRFVPGASTRSVYAYVLSLHPDYVVMGGYLVHFYDIFYDMLRDSAATLEEASCALAVRELALEQAQQQQAEGSDSVSGRRRVMHYIAQAPKKRALKKKARSLERDAKQFRKSLSNESIKACKEALICLMEAFFSGPLGYLLDAEYKQLKGFNSSECAELINLVRMSLESYEDFLDIHSSSQEDVPPLTDWLRVHCLPDVLSDWPMTAFPALFSLGDPWLVSQFLESQSPEALLGLAAQLPSCFEYRLPEHVAVSMLNQPALLAHMPWSIPSINEDGLPRYHVELLYALWRSVYGPESIEGDQMDLDALFPRRLSDQGRDDVMSSFSSAEGSDDAMSSFSSMEDSDDAPAGGAAAANASTSAQYDDDALSAAAQCGDFALLTACLTEDLTRFFQEGTAGNTPLHYLAWYPSPFWAMHDLPERLEPLAKKYGGYLGRSLDDVPSSESDEETAAMAVSARVQNQSSYARPALISFFCKEDVKCCALKAFRLFLEALNKKASIKVKEKLVDLARVYGVDLILSALSEPKPYEVKREAQGASGAASGPGGGWYYTMPGLNPLTWYKKYYPQDVEKAEDLLLILRSVFDYGCVTDVLFLRDLCSSQTAAEAVRFQETLAARLSEEGCPYRPKILSLLRITPVSICPSANRLDNLLFFSETLGNPTQPFDLPDCVHAQGGGAVAGSDGEKKEFIDVFKAFSVVLRQRLARLLGAHTADVRMMPGEELLFGRGPEASEVLGSDVPRRGCFVRLCRAFKAACCVCRGRPSSAGAPGSQSGVVVDVVPAAQLASALAFDGLRQSNTATSSDGDVALMTPSAATA